MKRLPIHQVAATGTRDDTTYLRGDGTWSTPSGGGSGGSVAIEDEGVEVVAAASRLNFTGSGVTASDAGSGEVTINVTGGGGGGGGGAGSGATIAATQTATGASPLSVSTAGIAAGDLCIWAVSTQNSLPDVLGPQGGGWTKLWQVDLATDEEAAAWYKIAGASEPATWTWAHAAGSTVASAMTAYRGVAGTLVHAGFRGLTLDTPSILGSSVGLHVCIWHSCYQTNTRMDIDPFDAGLLTKGADGYTTNAQQVLFAHEDTYFPAAVPGFKPTGGGNPSYIGCGAAVFE